MIFKTLRIQNFQSHADTIINFANGLNIIVGPSNTGKSAIIRALRKLIRDDPAGKDFIRSRPTKQTKCSISLTLEKNGVEYTVTRTVTPSKNLYYVNDHEFGGFGREIPKEVQDTLEMSLIELENSDEIDLHFVDQHDSPFMVARGSAGTRSKLLGRIGGLHILDRAITLMNKDMRAGNNSLKEKIALKDALQQKINTFPDLTGPEATLKRLTDDLEEIQSKQQLIDTLEKEFTALNDVITQGKQIKEQIDQLPTIEVDFTEFQIKITLLEELQTLRTQLQSLDDQINTVVAAIPDEISIDFNCIINQQQQLQELQTLLNSFTTLSNQITITEQKKNTCAMEVTQLRKEWVNALQELGVCPTCNQSTAHIGDCNAPN